MKTRLALAKACPIVLVILGVAGARLGAQEPVAQLQTRFDQETNSRQKAKLLVKLGEAQFRESRRAGEKGDYNAVGLLMEKYRDNAREAFNLLRKDYAKQSDFGGYRSMEMHVRKSLHELNETIVVAPPEYVPPLQIVRKDLEEIEDELLRLLFPRRPGEKPASPPKKNPPPA
jgi:hypothetical protein